MSIKIAPSILAADFGNLSLECKKIDNSNADWFHLDVMDGVFVPNISYGMPIVKSIRKMTKKPLDVHLMIIEPERYIDKFIEIGSDILTVHVEATSKMDNIIDKINHSGIKSGIAINPDKPKILYNLVPSTFPFGKNETIIIANKSSPKKVMYKGNSTNVLNLSLVVI